MFPMSIIARRSAIIGSAIASIVPVVSANGARPLTEFDEEVDALRGVLSSKWMLTTDELRRGIEAIPEADRLRLSYCGRSIRSITDNLRAKGVITEAELRTVLDRV
jgi:Nitrile hydratase beta subunit